MHDSADHPPIIDTPRAGLVLRQLRLDRCPGLIAQPKEIPHSPLQIRHSEARNLIC
jgi:hypothetical protein